MHTKIDLIKSKKRIADSGDDKRDDKKDKGDKGGKGDKKQVQMQSSAEPLPESAILIDHTRLKYLIDVFNESTSGCNF